MTDALLIVLGAVLGWLVRDVWRSVGALRWVSRVEQMRDGEPAEHYIERLVGDGEVRFDGDSCVITRRGYSVALKRDLIDYVYTTCEQPDGVSEVVPMLLGVPVRKVYDGPLPARRESLHTEGAFR